MAPSLSTGFESLAEEVKKLSNDPSVTRMVKERIADFMRVNQEDSSSWFVELVYCLLTAYSSAETGQRCVDALKERGIIFTGSYKKVSETLMQQGHRFAEKRAEYITAARSLAQKLKEAVQGFRTSREAREWLVSNVKGFGWKEGSHFLRNVGYFDVAILDRHILSNMREHGLIPDDDRKALTEKRYLQYEGILKGVADRLRMPLGEMDLYLWYRKTGKVLK